MAKNNAKIQSLLGSKEFTKEELNDFHVLVQYELLKKDLSKNHNFNFAELPLSDLEELDNELSNIE